MLLRFAVAFLLTGVCFAQNLSSRMDQVVQFYASKNQFMGSVLVARGDEVLFSKGYGFANLEWDIANTPSTKFRLASVSKQFTAAAILLLEERGKLKVEDLVKAHLPDAPAAWDKITIFNLLTHTSGITNESGQLPTIPFATTVANVARFRDKPLDFESGEKYNYSNNGYILLGYLVERLSGRTLEAFLKDNIFTPLGMKDSGYDSNSAVIARRASGYDSDPLKGAVNSNYIHMSIPGGAGALYSTTEDLLRWEQGLFGGKLLKAATLQKMTTPFKNGYAFGLGVGSANGRKTIRHNGAINGFNTLLTYYPESKTTVVVLSNLVGSALPQISTRLAALAHGENVTLQSERREIQLDPAVLARYTGSYRMAGGLEMLVTLEKNQLFGKLGNQDALPLLPETETRFYQKAVDTEIEFSGADPRGKATQVTRRQGAAAVQGARIDDAEVKRLAEAAAAIAKRIKDQKPMPDSESALRKMIEAWRLGQPDDFLMAPNLAAAVRQQLPELQSALKERGATQSLSFKGVSRTGGDTYDVKFQKGTWEYIVVLDADGKISGGQLRGIALDKAQ